MARNSVYSTADLVGAWSGATKTLSGTGMTATGTNNSVAVASPGNMVDGDITTFTQFGISNHGPFVATIDLGSIQPISAVAVNSDDPTFTASAWTLSVGLTTAGGTDFATTSAVGNVVTCTPAAGGAVLARYIVIGGSGQGLATEISIYEVNPAIAVGYLPSSGVTFGTVQNLSASFMPKVRKDLFGPAQNGVYAVDTADHEMQHEITAESCDITLDMLQLLALSAFRVSTTVASAITIGDSTVTVANATGMAAGDKLLVDVGGASPETVTVASIAANVVTITGTFAAAHLVDVAVADLTTYNYPLDAANTNVADGINIGQLPYFALSWTVALTNGGFLDFYAPYCKADGLSLKTTIADWAKNAVKFMAYPNAAGLIATITHRTS